MIKNKWVKLAVVFVIAFAIAAGVNWTILWLFGQKSSDRAVHGLVGIILLMAYTAMFVEKKENQFGPISFFLLAAVPCYAGTVFPDFDITLLGIGGHRNPLFHSSLSYFFLFFLLGHKGPFLRTITLGYGIGLASHLGWDVIDYGDVRWLPGSSIDRLWLGINGLLCFIPPVRK